MGATLLALVALCSPTSASKASDGPVEAISDGGFEETECPGSGDLGCYNPNWEVTSGLQAFTCFSPPCTTGLAASGSGFLGLGGNVMLNSTEEGSAFQEVDLPEGGSKVLTFEFRSASDDVHASGTFVAQVDGNALFTSSYAAAPSTYEMRSIDLRGYSGATTIGFTILCARVPAPVPVGCDGFLVDDVSLLADPDGEPAVETTFKRTPDRSTSRRRANFAFTSNAPEATFRCRLDGEPLGSCVSPLRLQVDRGRHRLAVRATADGITEDSPAVHRWRVERRLGSR